MSSRHDQPAGMAPHEGLSWEKPNPTLTWPADSTTALPSDEVPVDPLDESNNPGPNPEPPSYGSGPTQLRTARRGRGRSGQAASKTTLSRGQAGQTPKTLHTSPPKTKDPSRPTPLGRPPKRPPSVQPADGDAFSTTPQRAAKRPQTQGFGIASSSSSTRTSSRQRRGNPRPHTFNRPNATPATQSPVATVPQSSYELPGPNGPLDAAAFAVAPVVAQPAPRGISLVSGGDLFTRLPNSSPPGGLHYAPATANFSVTGPQSLHYASGGSMAPVHSSMIPAEDSIALPQGENSLMMHVRNEKDRFQEISIHWNQTLPLHIIHQSELTRIGFNGCPLPPGYYRSALVPELGGHVTLSAWHRLWLKVDEQKPDFSIDVYIVSHDHLLPFDSLIIGRPLPAESGPAQPTSLAASDDRLGAPSDYSVSAMQMAAGSEPTSSGSFLPTVVTVDGLASFPEPLGRDDDAGKPSGRNEVEVSEQADWAASYTDLLYEVPPLGYFTAQERWG